MTQYFFFYPHILDNLIPPESGFDVYQDMSDKRLRLYVTARGIKTFFTRKRVNKKDVRIILGNYPSTSIDMARSKLDDALEKIANPIKIRKKQMLFSRAISIFMDEKIHRAYESKQKLIRQIEKFLESLSAKYVNEIKESELSELINNIAKKHGTATANRMRELLKSLFNFAISKSWTETNPVTSIKAFAEHPRKNPLSITDVKKILAKIKHEEDQVLKNAFLMIIFGFMKKSEVFSMNWYDLDLKQDFYKSTPLTDAAAVLLQNLPQSGKWIFPGHHGHITDPRASWNKIVKSAGIPETQINDCIKLLRKQLKWSNNPETLRENMNKVLEKLE